MLKTLCVILCLFAFPAHAQGSTELAAESAWAMPSIGAAQNSVVYAILINRGAREAVLHAARSPLAERVELHSSVMENDIVRMREVPSVAIAPGASLRLEPGGVHLMVMGLRQPLKLGDTLPVTLEFEGGRTLELQVPVTGAATQED